jgi:hypothetical protein
MSGDPRFDYDDSRAYSVEKRRRPWAQSCLVGCLWTFAVLAILAVIGGFWIARRSRQWVADVGAGVVKQSIEASALPAAEKSELGAQIDRVAAAFRDGQLTRAQVQAIIELFVASPLATTLVVEIAEHQYFARSALSEEEKIHGRRALRRFARGVIDNAIPEASRDATLALVADEQRDGGWQLRNRVSDLDLRAFLAKAQADADAAGVAEEPAAVDPSDEVRRIVDQALATPATPEAPEPEDARLMPEAPDEDELPPAPADLDAP